MNDILQKLTSIIKLRRGESPKNSYSASLLDSGINGCSKKFGEEAIEVIIAAAGDDLNSFNNEAADLIFHFLILLEAKDANLNEILSILESRQSMSGHTEKALRKNKPYI